MGERLPCKQEVTSSTLVFSTRITDCALHSPFFCILGKNFPNIQKNAPLGMRTAAYKVGVASDRRRRQNVPRHILCYYTYRARQLKTDCATLQSVFNYVADTQQKNIPQREICEMFFIAPPVGLEPTTLRLTAECSTD